MTNTNTKTLSKTDAKYDWIKLILSLGILAIHAKVYPMVLFPWLRLAVPLFFIISSYFLFSKLQTVAPEEQKTVVKRFVIRNARLYACWLVILLPVTLYVRKDTFLAGSIGKSIVATLKSLFFGSTFIASWFLPAIILGVVIIYGLSKLLRKDFPVFLVALFAFVIVTLTSSYSSVIADTFLSAAIIQYLKVFGGLVCSFPAALLWVFVGKMFAEHKIRIQSLGLLIALTICSCVALFAEWRFVISLDGSYHNDSYFMLAPLGILLFQWIQRIKPLDWSRSVYVRHASTILYVTHGSVVIIVNKALSVVLGTAAPLLTFAVTLVGCMALYALIEWLIAKWPKNKLLTWLY